MEFSKILELFYILISSIFSFGLIRQEKKGIRIFFNNCKTELSLFADIMFFIENFPLFISY